MSEDNTPKNDSDSSNVVPLFGRGAPAGFPMPVWPGGDLADILDAIVGSSSNRDDDEFDKTFYSNMGANFQRDGRPSSLDIEACKVETTLFLMEDMSTSLQLVSLVTRDDALWDATVELQKCITKLLIRNQEIRESSEKNENDDQ